MNMAIKRRILSGLIVSSLVAVMLPVQAMASSSQITGTESLAPYQAILDSVNAQYGTDIHLITTQESLLTGIPVPTASSLGALGEFEAEIIALAEFSSATNAATQQATAAAQARAVGNATTTVTLDPIYEDGEVIGMGWSALALQTVKTGSLTKAMNGGQGNVTGTISNGNGYWQWLSYSSITFYIAAAFPKFYPDTISYSNLDNSRTCAVTWWGTYYSSSASTGSFISQYKEFGAASAAV
ncbi:MAG: hypothetical protein LBU07_05980 [Coriobacteriales bacterium]|jgi:hypothetical protein|nr:hypothetical protein [Coriobacteriales bacterium]